MFDMIYLFSLPGGMEWILIFLAVLLLFGGRKIPELMKGLGKGIREFNDARDKVKDEIEEGMQDEDSSSKKQPGKAESKQDRQSEGTSEGTEEQKDSDQKAS